MKKIFLKGPFFFDILLLNEIFEKTFDTRPNHCKASMSEGMSTQCISANDNDNLPGIFFSSIP